MLRLTTVVCSLVLFSACAVTSTEFSRDGFYVGASLMAAASDLENIDEAVDVEDVDYATGLGVRGGYRFLDRFSVELAGQLTDEWRDHDVSLMNVALQGKFFPLTGVVQPYVLGGVGAMRADVEALDETFDGGFLRLGAGLEIYIVKFLPIFVELEYTMGTGGTQEVNYTDGQIGVLWRF